MTKTYTDDEVQFVYPENWLLTDHSDGGIKQISVQSQNTSTWDFFSFPDMNTADQALREFMTSMSEQYDEFEAEPVETEIGNLTLSGIEAHFYCMDMLAVARAYAFEREGVVWMVAFQAESNEFQTNQQVLEAMTLGVLQDPS